MAKAVGLRTEILITLTLLLGAALLLGGMMMLHLMEKSLLNERIDQLNLMSRVLVNSLLTQNSESDDLSSFFDSKKTLQLLSQEMNCDAWWFFDQDLTLIESSVAGGNTPLTASRRKIAKMTGEVHQKIDFPVLLNFFNHTDLSAHFILPVKRGARFAGLLELNFSLADIRGKLLKTQQALLLYVFLYGAILVLSGYILLQRNIIKPARNLLEATQDVSRGNLETRLPAAGPLEIAQLADAYNQMAEALHASRADTEQNIISLETANQELQQTRDELIRSEKMASVGQLAAGLAHELGNPLSAIIGYLELLTKRIETVSDKDIVKRSLVEATRIDFLVRELLNFSRPTVKGQVEPVNMVAVLSSTVQLLKNQGAITNLKIINQLPNTLPLVKIDKNKLQQVFINLLLNAVQACGEQGKLTLSAGEEKCSVWVGVRDNGIGIDGEDLNKIFDPFYTTKPPGEGIGLGLPMCQRIVEEAGGVIEIDSVFGEGSIFKVIFLKMVT